MNDTRTEVIVEWIRNMEAGINGAPRGQVVIDFAGQSIAIRVSATIEKTIASKSA